MDKYTIAEEAYKNGYTNGFNDAMDQNGRGRKDPTSRKAKWEFFKQELSNWGYADWHSDTIDVMKAVVNELSWRVIVRIIHKLKRKRGSDR